MSTVNVDLPEDIENELDDFLEDYPEFSSREEAMVEFSRFMLEAEKSIEAIKQSTYAYEAGEAGQSRRSMERAAEATDEARDALLEFFGVPRKLSEDTLAQIEESREQFERGEYVALEDA